MSRSRSLKNGDLRLRGFAAQLQHVHKLVARQMILSTALPLVRGIREGRVKISDAEQLLFNLDMLLLCTRTFKDRPLAGVISYGMELEAVSEWVKKPRALQAACDELEEMVTRLLENPKKKVA